MTQSSFSTSDTSMLPFIVKVAETPVPGGGLNGGYKAVLLALGTFCLDGDWCYPKTDSIARRASVSIRQAQKALSEWSKAGIVERFVSSGRRASRYRVHPRAINPVQCAGLDATNPVQCAGLTPSSVRGSTYQKTRESTTPPYNPPRNRAMKSRLLSEYAERLRAAR